MGEAKIRKRRHRAVLEAFPYCIYCGGETPATTADHVPARSFFDRRHRPKGLEFPACGPCNVGASEDELIGAMLSRISPDLEFSEELKEYALALKKRCPALIAEMFAVNPSDEARAQSFDPNYLPLNVSGPRFQSAMHRLAAKIGYAFHFDLTGRSSPVPQSGGAYAGLLANSNFMMADIPDGLPKIINNLGLVQTLRQGSWEVEDQFRYRRGMCEDNPVMGAPCKVSFYYAVFRKNLGLYALVRERRENFIPLEGDDPHIDTYVPGFLQKDSVKEAPSS